MCVWGRKAVSRVGDWTESRRGVVEAFRFMGGAGRERAWAAGKNTRRWRRRRETSSGRSIVEGLVADQGGRERRDGWEYVRLT